jgi:Spy/CpxP family protein refolding chaperone
VKLATVGLLGLSLLLASPLYAQYGGGPPSGGWSGRGGHGGFRGMRGGGSRMDLSSLPTQDEIDGPPTPDTFKQMFQLSDDQTTRYTQAYDSLMTRTKPARDSARVAMQSLRTAMDARDRSAVRQQADLLGELGKELSKGDDSFDKSVKPILTKDQRKQYDDWKKDRKKAADEERKNWWRSSGARNP